MKNSKLIIGLGIGALVVGAATAAYFLTSDEKKQQIMDDIDDAVKRAKRKVKNAVDSGMYEIDEAAEKVNRAAKDALDKVKSHI